MMKTQDTTSSPKSTQPNNHPTRRRKTEVLHQMNILTSNHYNVREEEEGEECSIIYTKNLNDKPPPIHETVTPLEERRKGGEINNTNVNCHNKKEEDGGCKMQFEEDCSQKSSRRRANMMVTFSARNLDDQRWMRWTVIAFVVILNFVGSALGDNNGLISNWERPSGLPKITHLEVMCGNQHMEVHLSFDKPFQGLVTSKGMYGHQDCLYVPPRSGSSTFIFNIYYNKCGTKPDNHGKFYENTIVVQFDEQLIEAWDEAKRLRCEWFNDYEKTATKTNPMVISDLDVVELNFHGDNVDCWMEIQEGKGPWSQPLSGIVPLGSPLTMVIAVKDPSGEFDMRVKECEASDGDGGRKLQLSDAEGCVVREKLLGKFSKIKVDDSRATVLTYAFISAFKFPDMLNVHLRCTVEICRHGCPDHCTSSSPTLKPELKSNTLDDPLPSPSQTKEVKVSNMIQNNNNFEQNRFPPMNNMIYNAKVPPQMRPPPPPLMRHGPPPYSGRPQRAPRPPMLMRQRPGFGPGPVGRMPFLMPPPQHGPRFATDLGQNSNNNVQLVKNNLLEQRQGEVQVSKEEGRVNNEEVKESESGSSGEKREMLMEAQPLTDLKPEEKQPEQTDKPAGPFPKGPRSLRHRRSISTPSDTIGVQGIFRVVSQADVDFTLNNSTTNNNIFKGKILANNDAIYGICLPRVGFGIVFFGLGLMALVAVVVAVGLAWGHYHQNIGVRNGGQREGGVEGYCNQQASMQSYHLFPMVVFNRRNKMW